MLHFVHHGRFYVAAGLGIAAFLASYWLGMPLRLLVAGNTVFVAYLALMLHFVHGVTPEHLRRRASVADEGVALILVLTVLAIALSLGSMFKIINQPQAEGVVEAGLAVASVPLGWLMLHTMCAFHYASMYYKQTGAAAARKDVAGLEFPGSSEPGAGDFLYFSFVVGMTAQVSDVVVTAPAMRQAVLLHSIASFFYNTVLLALAVNAALNFAD